MFCWFGSFVRLYKYYAPPPKNAPAFEAAAAVLSLRVPSSALYFMPFPVSTVLSIAYIAISSAFLAALLALS